MLALQGKIEMAKRTIQLQRKPKNAQNAIEEDNKVLVYKDGDDSSGEEDEQAGDSESGDEESEEEIQQIPIAGKRKKLAGDDDSMGYGDEGSDASDDDGPGLDDSVEDSGADADDVDSEAEKELREKLADSSESDEMMEVDDGDDSDSEDMIK